MARADVTPIAVGNEGIRVGLGLRDSSATILGLCLSSPRIPSDIPALAAGGRRLEPMGGTFTDEDGTAFNYSYYPATASEKIAVVQGSRRLGTLRFPSLTDRDCPLSASESFRTIACGAIVVVEWQSALRFDPAELELVDAEVWEQGNRARRLGFLFHEERAEREGLVIRFGFRPPAGNRVLLAVGRVYVVEEGSRRPVEVVLDPPVRARFTLS
jgi:hypothetical protein